MKETAVFAANFTHLQENQNPQGHKLRIMKFSTKQRLIARSKLDQGLCAVFELVCV